MQAARKYLCLLASLAFTAPLYSQQLTGSVEGSGGWNFQSNNKENILLKLNYETSKWYIKGSLEGKHDYNSVDIDKYSLSTDGSILDLEGLPIEEVLPKVKKFTIDIQESPNRNFGAAAYIDAGIHLSQSDELTASLKYDYAYSWSDPQSLGTRFTPKVDTLAGYQGDTKTSRKNTVNLAAAYTHSFDNFGRQLSASLSSLARWDDEGMERILANLIGSYYKDDNAYRAPSYLIDYNANLKLRYSDKRFLGIDNLGANTGVDFIVASDLDRFWSTQLIDEVWVDRPEYNQRYAYMSLAVEPYLNLKYNWGNFNFDITERVQFYGHQLYNAGTVERPESPEFRNNDIRNLLSLTAGYKFSDRHKLSLEYSHGITRPDYAKLSSIIKIGDFEGEYYVGNHELAPEYKDNVKLRYDYTFRKTLNAYALLNFMDQRNRAERIIDNTTKEGVKYYTYINAQRMVTSSARVGVTGSWKNLKADVYGQFNGQIIGYKDESRAKKYTTNWEFIANVSYQFPKAFLLTLSGGYASRKQTAYNLTDAYIPVNLRLTKTFLDKFDVYLEGRDLADRTICTYTWNEAADYCAVSNAIYQRRSLALGLKYSF